MQGGVKTWTMFSIMDVFHKLCLMIISVWGKKTSRYYYGCAREYLADYHTRQGEKGRAGELISWIELYMVPSIPGHYLPLYYKLLGDLSLDRKSRFNAYRFYKAAYYLRPTEDVRGMMEGLEEGSF